MQFEGNKPAIGCVLGLKFEKFTKKVPFEIFLEKMSNYVISNLTDSHLIQLFLLDQEDPLKAYEPDQKPTSLESTATDMDKEILKESIKQFVQ